MLRQTGRLGEGCLCQLGFATCLPEPFADAGLEVGPGAVRLWWLCDISLARHHSARASGLQQFACRASDRLGQRPDHS